MLSDTDELLDLVDEHDRVVGTITHDAVYDGDGLQDCYVRSASCFIMNSQGKLWIPRRLATKKIAPNGLDYSAGGHVQAGESYDQAIIREVAEEINLSVTADQLVPIGKEVPATAPPHYYFSQIYLYLSDTVPEYNHDDFSGFEWLTPLELQSRLAAGEPAKLSLPNSVDMVLAYVAEHQGDH